MNNLPSGRLIRLVGELSCAFCSCSRVIILMMLEVCQMDPAYILECQHPFEQILLLIRNLARTSGNVRAYHFITNSKNRRHTDVG